MAKQQANANSDSFGVAHAALGLLAFAFFGGAFVGLLRSGALLNPAGRIVGGPGAGLAAGSGHRLLNRQTIDASRSVRRGVQPAPGPDLGLGLPGLSRH